MNVFHLRLHLAFALFFLLIGGQMSGQSFRRSYLPEGSICFDLIENADGGFMMVGASADSSLFLQRTNADGAIIWTANQQLNGARGIAVCPAPDGGFALLCENYLDGSVLRNLLLKIDSAGAIQWQKILPNPNLHNGFKDLIAVSSGGYALVGDARTFVPVSDFHIQLLRLDAAGNELWTQFLGDLNSGKELALGLVEMPNGDFVAAGERRDAPSVLDGSDFFLARTNAQGNALWQIEYPKPGYQTARDFKVDHNGNLILLGETKQMDPVNATLLKTSGDGTELWFRQALALLNQPAVGQWRLINCFALDHAGSIYMPYLQLSTSTLAEELLLQKINTDGDSVWTHESDLQDLPYAALYTSNDQFAFGGSTGTGVLPAKAVLIKSDWAGGFNAFLSSLYGNVYWDQNLNCSPDAQEPVPPQFIVKAENQFGDIYFRQVSATGYYNFSVNPGDFSITVHPVPGTETLWQACDTPMVSVAALDTALQVPPLGVQSTADCPVLAVELVAGYIRRCTTNTYVVNYCNYGSQTASNAFVQLILDPLCSFVSSGIPLTAQSGDTLFFDLADVLIGDCKSFYVKVLLDCAAEFGQTICSEAHIFPDSSCLPPDPLWDGSHLEVSASCNGNAVFTVSNTGIGNMAGAVDYIIIEDQIMYRQGSIQIPAGADTTLTIINPTGTSYYVQTGQRPGHPGNSLPAAVVDMCNGQNGPSLAMQLPLNSNDAFADFHCGVVVSAFDPNDKNGFPLGWRNEHFIEIGQDIEYIIRFQNTGNDTAFLVVIRDTLMPELNPATVRPGPSSHPYQFQVDGSGALRFSFSNILLPDSTTNEPESHGFVSFKVSQRPELPLGTVVENTAAIYFDFNDPVITNTYFHTIGHALLSFTLAPPAPGALDMRVFPNPATGYAELRIEGQDDSGPYHFSLYSAAGQLLRKTDFSGNRYLFERGALPPGLYFFKLENANGNAAGGKLMLK